MKKPKKQKFIAEQFELQFPVPRTITLTEAIKAADEEADALIKNFPKSEKETSNDR